MRRQATGGRAPQAQYVSVTVILPRRAEIPFLAAVKLVGHALVADPVIHGHVREAVRVEGGHAARRQQEGGQALQLATLRGGGPLWLRLACAHTLLGKRQLQKSRSDIARVVAVKG